MNKLRGGVPTWICATDTRIILLYLLGRTLCVVPRAKIKTQLRVNQATITPARRGDKNMSITRSVKRLKYIVRVFKLYYSIKIIM